MHCGCKGIRYVYLVEENQLIHDMPTYIETKNLRIILVRRFFLDS